MRHFTPYYNPEQGRFVNADGYLGTPGELLSFNMFTCCSNNVINFYDPNGTVFQLVVGLLVMSGRVAVVAAVCVIAGLAYVAHEASNYVVTAYQNANVSYSSSTSSSGSGSSDTPSVGSQSDPFSHLEAALMLKLTKTLYQPKRKKSLRKIS